MTEIILKAEQPGEVNMSATGSAYGMVDLIAHGAITILESTKPEGVEMAVLLESYINHLREASCREETSRKEVRLQ